MEGEVDMREYDYRFQNESMEYENQKEYQIPPQKPRRKGKFLKKATAFVLSAILFGGISGMTFYSVSEVLENQLPQTVQSDTVDLKMCIRDRLNMFD